MRSVASFDAAAAAAAAADDDDDDDYAVTACVAAQGMRSVAAPPHF